MPFAPSSPHPALIETRMERMHWSKRRCMHWLPLCMNALYTLPSVPCPLCPALPIETGMKRMHWSKRRCVHWSPSCVNVLHALPSMPSPNRDQNEESLPVKKEVHVLVTIMCECPP